MNGKTTTKALLMTLACIETPMGLLLLVFPSWVAAVLLGAPCETGVAVLFGRLAGAGVLSLGVACGLGSRDEESWATAGIVAAMLIYSLATAVLLAWAWLDPGSSGMGQLPVAALHVATAVWCVSCWRSLRSQAAFGAGMQCLDRTTRRGLPAEMDG